MGVELTKVIVTGSTPNLVEDGTEVYIGSVVKNPNGSYCGWVRTLDNNEMFMLKEFKFTIQDSKSLKKEVTKQLEELFTLVDQDEIDDKLIYLNESLNYIISY